MTRFLGIWRKTELGLGSRTWKGGEPQSEDMVICRTDEIPALLSFLAENYPEQFGNWSAARTTFLIREGRQPVDDRRVWLVQSNSDPNIVYEVVLQNGRWSCECQGFGYRHKCSHIEQVRTRESL